jgi:hypothetical protein
MDHSAHWMLGQPDALYAAKQDAQPAPAPRFVRFTVDTTHRNDVWVRAMDFKPADKRAIRAAFFSVAGSGQYLGGWTPWHASTELPEGVAFRLPARAVINIDVLSASRELPGEPPRLGLYFTETVRQPLANLALTGDRVSPDGRMRADLTLDADRALVEVRADMSPGGKSLERKAVRPDGTSQPLLWIRDFKQEWQTPYVFRAPVSLPRGTVIRAIASFDRAAAAPRLRVTVNAAAGQRASA